MARLKALRCTISRGGFSDERVFTVEFNGISHRGVASRQHMWNANGVPLEDGEPPLGDTVKGYVAARVLEIEADGQALVSVPDGEVISVPQLSLCERPSGEIKNVPV